MLETGIDDKEVKVRAIIVMPIPLLIAGQDPVIELGDSAHVRNWHR